MKKKLSLTGLALAFAALTACQQTALPGNIQSQTALLQAQSRKKQVTKSPARSDQILDAVAKRMVTSYFRIMDTDNNGALTGSEVSLLGWSAGDASLSTIDKDKDGRITLAEFQTFDFSKITRIPFSRNGLRTIAKSKWDRLNSDKNQFLIFGEVLKDYPDYGAVMPITQPPAPPPYGGGSPVNQPPTPPYGGGNGYGNQYGNDSDYGNQYGNGGYDNGNPSYNEFEAKTFFNLADINLDHRLTFSEFEDAEARLLLMN